MTEMSEIMIPLVGFWEHQWAYIGAMLGILVVEQRIYNGLTPNGKSRFSKWWDDRKDDVIVEVPLTIGFVANLNYIWYFLEVPFTWSNFWTGLACGLISMLVVYALLDLAPMLIVLLKDKIVSLAKKWFGSKEQEIENKKE